MFEVGFSELVVIALVALLVLGPEKLPGAARTLGGLVRRARASWQSLQGELERELAATDLKNPLGTGTALPDLGQIGKDLRATVHEVDQALRPPPPTGAVAPAATPVVAPLPPATAATTDAAAPAAVPTAPPHD